MMDTEYCPMCGQKHEHISKHGESSRSLHMEVYCDFCGPFALSEDAIIRLERNPKEKMQLRHLLREKYIKDKLQIEYEEIRFGRNEYTEELLKNAILIVADNDDIRMKPAYDTQYTLDQFLRNYPQTVTDKLERAMCNIARWQLNSSEQDIMPDDDCLFAKDSSEAKYFVDLLTSQGFLTESAVRVTNSSIPYLKLSAYGWQRFEELERNWQNSTTAFIAMWFNEATEKYRDAVKEAVRQAGYDPKVIDDHEHNNFIMDEVINQINEAKFVIADFTCVKESRDEKNILKGGVRGGVYFEAGYARGLGKEVIVTCKDDEEANERRHFDIDQLNTLFWSENNGKLFDSNGNDFTHRLAERIKATVGKGKLIN